MSGRPDATEREQRQSSSRVFVEILRRKGLSVEDAQMMPDRPEPWYIRLTWNEAEERARRSKRADRAN